MQHKNINNRHTLYRNCLLRFVNDITPTLGLVLNHGISSIHGELYSFRLEQITKETTYVAPKYHNSLYADTTKIVMNAFVLTGTVLHSSIHKGRTYVTIRQFSDGSVLDVKCVIDGEVYLDNYLGSPCIILGYLFPRPLGTYGLSVSACCEVLKIKDTIVHSIELN